MRHWYKITLNRRVYSGQLRKDIDGSICSWIYSTGKRITNSSEVSHNNRSFYYVWFCLLYDEDVTMRVLSTDNPGITFTRDRFGLMRYLITQVLDGTIYLIDNAHNIFRKIS